MAAERFDAFISYARTPSTTLASELQRGIERFAKPWNRLRACRVFRDDASMSANSGLWSTIENALKEARWFVLIATPEAGASEYVDKEVAWWVANKGAASILLVHQAGALVWDRTANGFSAASDAVPPALRRAYAEEPRWIDFTWFGTDTAAADTAAAPVLGQSDPRFTERVADLAATIRGIERDTLIGDNVREHRRTRRLARGAAVALSALLVASIAAGIVAVVQGTEAASQRDLAREQLRVATARQLASTARNEAENDLEKALLLAASGYALEPDAQTYSALIDVNNVTPELSQFLSAGDDAGSTILSAAGTPDASTIVAGTADGRVLMWSLDSSVFGAAATRPVAPTPTEIAVLDGEVRFVEVSDDAAIVVAEATRPIEGSPTEVSRDGIIWSSGTASPMVEGLSPLALSGDGSVIVAVTVDAVRDGFQDLDVVTLRDGVEVSRHPASLPPSWITVPDASTVVSMDEYGSGLVETIGGGTTAWTSPMGTWQFGGALSPSGTMFTFTNGESDMGVWDVPGDPAGNGSATMSANAPDARPTSLALSDGGLLATARAGVIYLGQVVPHGGPVPAARELRGAGNDPTELAFLDDDTLLSVSGSSVALWSLGSLSRMADTMPFGVPDGCAACGPLHVAVDPSGTRVIGVSDSFPPVAYVDSASGHSIDDLRDTLDFGDATEAVWLDEERVYLTDGVEYTVLTGEDQFAVESQGVIGGDLSGVERVVLRDDGLLVFSDPDSTSVVDPQTGSVTATYPMGGTVTRDGRLLVSFGREDGASESLATGAESPLTVATVFDLDDAQERARTVADEGFIPVAARTGDDIALWTDAGGGSAGLLTLDIESGAVQDHGSTPAPSAITDVQPANMLVSADNGYVTATAIDPTSTVELLDLPPGVRQWTSLGVPKDGRSLVAVNEPGQTVSFLSLRHEDWTHAACTVADSRLTADEWHDVTGERELYLDACDRGSGGATAAEAVPSEPATAPAPDDTATASPAPAAPTPTPTTSASPGSSTALPSSCEAVYTPAFAAALRSSGAVLNPDLQDGSPHIGAVDPVLFQDLQNRDRLDCFWRTSVEAGAPGLNTSISLLTGEMGGELAGYLAASGYACYDELGGRRCTKESGQDGESHFIRDGRWLATSWQGFAPDGYTHDMITAIFGG